MRIEFPRFDSFDDPAEGISITFVTTSMNRDALGEVYRFSVNRDGMPAEVDATVGRSTSLYASAKALSEGLDYWSWPMAEARQYETEFAERFGHYFVVRRFGFRCEPWADLVMMRDIFIRTFFDYASSYRYNRSDYVDGCDGYYPDQLEFTPDDMDRQHHTLVTVGDLHPLIDIGRR